MYGYIYLTQNLTNNRKYIGQRKWNTFENISEDKYLGSGIILKQAIQKYGEGNFKKQILCICDTKEELCSMEKKYIQETNAINSDDYYNIHEGGNGGNTRAGYTTEEMEAFKLKMKTVRKNYTHSVETRKKISEAGLKRPNHMKLPKYRKMFSEKFKGENNPMFGRKLSDEQIQKLKDSHNGKFDYNKGIIMSEEQKEKISNSLKETWKDEEVRNKWIESKYGRVQSEETKHKMSIKAYERYQSFPLDNNIIIYQYDDNKVLINTFYGIDEYYSKFKTKTCRNLKYAIRDNTKFKNSYWKVEFKSQSTIETTSKDVRK